MRKDLAERLRAIVRQTPAVSRADVDAAVRELTLEPSELTIEPLEHKQSQPGPFFGDAEPASIARAFGGTFLHDDPSTHCLVIDRVFDSTRSHGRWPIERSRLAPEMPLSVFDGPAGRADAWWSQPVFFDTETTGISGGAGTIAFLAGCGWFDANGFRVRQWLLTSQAGEKSLLDELGRAVENASLLVSYNGRAFDVPLMEMRWAFHRRSSPFAGVPHFDMLPAARKLWSRRESAFDYASGESSGCSLSTLERDVLGFHRHGDVPGIEIPSRYFLFLRSGDPSVLDGVLDHHCHDILSLAVLMAHALRLVEHGPDLCRTDHEVIALGRVYERARLLDRARETFERAALSADRYVRAHAFSRLGLMHRRALRHEDAARAWQGVLEAAGGRRSLFQLERLAIEALAIHHEHRAQDLDEARRYAETMRAQATGRAASDAAHRLARLERKLSDRKKKGGPEAAPLLGESE